jgi:hypothetical protein
MPGRTRYRLHGEGAARIRPGAERLLPAAGAIACLLRPPEPWAARGKAVGCARLQRRDGAAALRPTRRLDLRRRRQRRAPSRHAIFAEPLRRRSIRSRRRVPCGRRRWGGRAVLVVLWLLAQLNPRCRSSGRNIGDGDPPAVLVTAGSVALSVAGFGFFVSVVLKGVRAGRSVDIVLLSVALWCKFAMAAVMLKLPRRLGDGAACGPRRGDLAFVPLRGCRTARIYRHRPHAGRRPLRQIFGAYSPSRLPPALQRPYGQLATFSPSRATPRGVAGAGARVAVRPLRVAARQPIQ